MLCLMMPVLEMVVISVSVHEGPCERHEGLPECHQDGPHLLSGLLQCRQCVLPHAALQTGQPNCQTTFLFLVFGKGGGRELPRFFLGTWNLREVTNYYIQCTHHKEA